jgi:hypothetical protein
MEATGPNGSQRAQRRAKSPPKDEEPNEGQRVQRKPKRPTKDESCLAAGKLVAGWSCFSWRCSNTPRKGLPQRLTPTSCLWVCSRPAQQVRRFLHTSRTAALLYNIPHLSEEPCRCSDLTCNNPCPAVRCLEINYKANTCPSITHQRGRRPNRLRHTTATRTAQGLQGVACDTLKPLGCAS